MVELFHSLKVFITFKILYYHKEINKTLSKDIAWHILEERGPYFPKFNEVKIILVEGGGGKENYVLLPLCETLFVFPPSLKNILKEKFVIAWEIVSNPAGHWLVQCLPGRNIKMNNMLITMRSQPNHHDVDAVVLVVTIPA